MAKLVGRVSATIKRNSGKGKVKAGSTNKSHGGFPTQKVIIITSKINKK